MLDLNVIVNLDQIYVLHPTGYYLTITNHLLQVYQTQDPYGCLYQHH